MTALSACRLRRPAPANHAGLRRSEEFDHADSEQVAQPDQRPDCEVLLAVFQALHVLRVDPGPLGEFLLGETPARPKLGESPTQVADDLVGIDRPHRPEAGPSRIFETPTLRFPSLLMAVRVGTIISTAEEMNRGRWS